MRGSTKRLTLCALFVALSFVLANIKIMGSVAFDSLPAFLCGLLLGGLPGAVVGAVAHMLTAALSGFPFGLPVHLIVAAVMFVTVFAFTLSYRLVLKAGNAVAAVICSGIVGTALNGPFAVFALQPFLLPVMGEAGLFSFSVVLTLAAAANIALAFVVYFALRKAKIAKEAA